VSHIVGVEGALAKDKIDSILWINTVFLYDLSLNGRNLREQCNDHVLLSLIWDLFSTEESRNNTLFSEKLQTIIP
jgi:hypothetical protein